MIKNVLSDIGGVGLYGVVSVLLFFTVFTGTLLFALLKKKPFLNYMGALPLSDGSEINSTKQEVSRHE
jgi:hypothetical protein